MMCTTRARYAYRSRALCSMPLIDPWEGGLCREGVALPGREVGLEGKFKSNILLSTCNWHLPFAYNEKH